MACHFHSPIRPSPLHNHYQWPPNPNRSTFPHSLTSFRTHPSRLTPITVLHQGAESLSPVSLPPRPQIEPDGGQDEVSVVPVDGREEDETTLVTSTLTRVKKKRVDIEDSSDDRFKLRNGKEIYEEKAYMVGVEWKGDTVDSFTIEESLKELSQLVDAAGLLVVDSTYQKLASPNPRTYIGSGKVAEIKSATNALDVETVIFDDELSPGKV